MLLRSIVKISGMAVFFQKQQMACAYLEIGGSNLNRRINVFVLDLGLEALLQFRSVIALNTTFYYAFYIRSTAQICMDI